MLYHTTLYYGILYSIILYYTILYYTILCYGTHLSFLALFLTVCVSLQRKKGQQSMRHSVTRWCAGSRLYVHLRTIHVNSSCWQEDHPCLRKITKQKLKNTTRKTKKYAGKKTIALARRRCPAAPRAPRPCTIRAGDRHRKVTLTRPVARPVASPRRLWGRSLLRCIYWSCDIVLNNNRNERHNNNNKCASSNNNTFR